MDFHEMTLERGGCLGTCPVYRVSVRSDGSVEWEGLYFVEQLGPRTWAISQEQLEHLKKALRKAKFTEFNDRYDEPAITDCPSATITVAFSEGQTKSVYHDHGVVLDPADADADTKLGMLNWLENRIDKIVGTKDYIGNGRASG